MENVFYLHAQQSPIAHYLRIGASGHRQLEQLLEAEKRVLVEGIDRLLSASRVETIMAASQGRRLLSCADRSCCGGGFDHTLKSPKGHFLQQRFRALAELSRVPEPLRVKHFIENQLGAALRTSLSATKLKLPPEQNKLAEVLQRSHERLERMRPVMENLHATLGEPPRALTPKRRVGAADRGGVASRGRS